MGLKHRLESKGCAIWEGAFWNQRKGSGLERSQVGPEITAATNYPYAISVHQGHTESLFIEDLHSRGFSVDRAVSFVDFKESGKPEYPLIAYLKNLVSGVVEKVPTKYILGCDGAGSKVRAVLGIGSAINESQFSWAVADTCAKSNFPDIRRRCSIRTENGNLMLIPQINKGLRIYTLLSEKDLATLSASKYEGKGPAFTNDNTLVGIVESRVQKILKPYHIQITKVTWSSTYYVAQRIADSYTGSQNRVFILGDACHTHSTSAAQGLNVSMNDAYNLTWKLSLVLRRIATPSLLNTYQAERQHIGKQLVEFDHKISHMYASLGTLGDSELHSFSSKSNGFTSGCGHQYLPGLLTDGAVNTEIDYQAIDPLTPGKRMYPFRVTRHYDGVQINILDDLPSNGKFHIFVFAGELAHQGKLDSLSRLLSSPASPLTRFSKPRGIIDTHDVLSSLAEDRDTVVDLYLVHTSNHLDTSISSLPTPFPQWQPRIYEDVKGQAHSEVGINVHAGALVIVRPDGYVGLIAGMEDGDRVNQYLESFLTVDA